MAFNRPKTTCCGKFELFFSHLFGRDRFVKLYCIFLFFMCGAIVWDFCSDSSNPDDNLDLFIDPPLPVHVKLLRSPNLNSVVIDTWVHALTGAEITYQVVTRVDHHDSAVYILFDFLYFLNRTRRLPRAYVVYNTCPFEQFYMAIAERKLQSRFHAPLVYFEHSLLNSLLLSQRGIHSVFLPFGWSSSTILTRSSLLGETRRLNIMFVGKMNGRRKQYLEIPAARHRILPISTASFEHLNSMKIALLINPASKNSVLDAPSIVQLVSAGVWVISERSSDQFYEHRFRDCVTFISSPSEMSDAIAAVMSMPAELFNRKTSEMRTALVAEKNSFQSHFVRIIAKHGRKFDSNISNSDALVTFIIPSKGRKCIKFTLLSLLAQSDSRWQAIVIFDGSSKVAPKLNRLTDPRIKYVVQTFSVGGDRDKNWAGTVRNFGVQYANTEWVAFVDDDDSLASNYVYNLAMHVQYRPDVDCVIFRLTYCSPWNFHGRVLPRMKDASFQATHVGISFAVRRNVFFCGLSFRPSPIEDFMFLENMRLNRNVMVISHGVHYFVKCTSVQEINRVLSRINPHSYPTQFINAVP